MTQLSRTPEIRVFKSEEEALVLNWVMDRGFSPNYDAVNKVINWSGEHRFYEIIDNVWCECENVGHLMIAFLQGIEISQEQWNDVLHWMNCPDTIEKRCPQLLRADALLLRDIFKTPEVSSDGKLINSEPVIQPEVETLYEFRYEPYENGFLYEVKKPNTDYPYTVYEESRKDHIGFFSALFVCDSWGVARTDYAFLTNAWKEMGIAGECNLEELVKKRVEDVHKGSDEPIVYRRPMCDVIVVLEERKNRTGQKRKAITINDPRTK